MANYFLLLFTIPISIWSTHDVCKISFNIYSPYDFREINSIMKTNI